MVQRERPETRNRTKKEELFVVRIVSMLVCAGARVCMCVRVHVCSQTPNTGLRHPSLEEGAGKRC